MRVSVLACLALGVCALLGAVGPAAGDISDLQCKNGNSDANGLCPVVANTDSPWKPTYNRADNGNGISYEVDRLYVSKVNLTTDQPDKHNDGQVDVHRITWEANNGVGNTGRSVSTTIGRDLPAGFQPFPFQMSYRADGLNFQPRTDIWPDLGQTVIFFEAEFLYILKNVDNVQKQIEIFYPNLGGVPDPASQLWLLFQPNNGYGLTAGPVSLSGTGTETPEPKYYALGAVNTFGPRGTLPNNGLGTYFLTWRVVAANARFNVTTDMAVTSGQTLQSVGGPNAPGNTYRVTKLANAYDAPVLSNLAVPAANGAFLTFTLALVDAAPPGKVFISQAVLTIKSVTPVDSSVEGVRLSGTYTLDTSANSVAVDSYVQGTQKLYVRPSGTTSNDWAPLANSAYDSNNKQVTYTLSASDANSFGSVPSLDMAVLADIPVSSSSSSTGESSSSSTAQEPVPSSTAQEPVPSSTAESSTAGPLSSTAQPSSSTAPPSSSTGASSSSAPSSTGAVPSASSSSTAVPPSSSSSSGSSFSSSSSSSGSSNSSSSSTAPSEDDGSASSVSANGVAVALAAAAAVAALYA